MKKQALNISLLLCVILGISCSTGRNTPYSRAYKELRTRYNIFHNAQESYDNILNEQLAIFMDDRNNILPIVYSAGYNIKKTGKGGPFDIVINKAERAISDYSITSKPRRNPTKAYSEDYRKWLKQEEFNPFISNVWLLLGKAHFQNGDYDEALSVFAEIIRIFPNDTDLTSEAHIWMLRSYSEMSRFYDAQNLIYILQTRTLSNDLNILFTESVAHYLLKTGQYHEAIPYIRQFIEKEKNRLKRKGLQFLLGQVYTLIGDYEKAVDSFKDLKRINTSKELYLNASAYIDAISSGKNQADSLALLLRNSQLNENIRSVAVTELNVAENSDQTEYKDSFQLYWEANLKRNISKPLLNAYSIRKIERDFTIYESSPHALILLPSEQSDQIKDLLFVTANFNFSNFKFRTFNLSTTIIERREALKIEPFSSYDDVSRYLHMLKSDTVYRSSLPETITPVIISKSNLNILQSSTLESYYQFYTANFNYLPEDFSPVKISLQEESSLQTESDVANIYIEDSLSLETDYVAKPVIDKIEISDERQVNLKLLLEQKASEMMKRANKSTITVDRAEQIKKREQIRNERLKSREKELKERERKRELEIKQRERERELKLKAQKRDRR